jgi:hypothetical protein
MVALKPAPMHSLKTPFLTVKTTTQCVSGVCFRPQKGARYLNPQTGLWLSTDPAMGEYVPQAPINDDVRKQNQNLPGMGGVFNVANLHVYHYAGNNPIRYTDPDGKNIFDDLIKWITNACNKGKDFYNENIAPLTPLFSGNNITPEELLSINLFVNMKMEQFNWKEQLGILGVGVVAGILSSKLIPYGKEKISSMLARFNVSLEGVGLAWSTNIGNNDRTIFGLIAEVGDGGGKTGVFVNILRFASSDNSNLRFELNADINKQVLDGEMPRIKMTVEASY